MSHNKKASGKKKWGGGKAKNDNRTGRYYKSGDKLSKFPGDAGTGMDHNYFPWYRDWEIKIGEYGEDFKEQFPAGEITPFDPDEKKNAYSYKTKKCLDSQAFTYTDRQIEHIEMMKQNNDSNMKVDNYMARCFESWYNQRALENAEIERENTYNSERIKICVKDSKDYRDKATKLFSNILTSMSETSQQLVKNYKNVLEKETKSDDGEASSRIDDKTYAISDAEKDLDWMWLFHAAKETHVRNLAEGDEATTEERQQNELHALRTMYHKSGTFTRWTERFEDRVRVIESLGYDIPDVQKRCAFMRNLNKEIFKTAISDWNNMRTRNNFKSTYEGLKEEIMQEYLAVMSREPELVHRVERPPREAELSFAGGKAPCEICEGNHLTDDCRWRNKKFPVKANKRYYMNNKDKDKEDSEAKSNGKPIKETKGEAKQSKPAEPKSEPFKGTVAQPPAKKEGSNRLIELTYDVLETDKRTMIIDDLKPEVSLRSRPTQEEVVFIYDTGSVSGAVTPDSDIVLSNLREEDVLIEGQGGAIQKSAMSGDNTFGVFRRLSSAKGNLNLISHVEAERNWQLVHPRRGYMQLREWPDRRMTGKTWHLYSDKQTWGDPLPRLVISRHELKDLFKSGSSHEKSLTFLEPDAVPNIPVSSDQLKIIEKVDMLHLKLGHASADQLIKIIKSEDQSDVIEKLKLGISTDDVKLWDEQRGRYCSGCLQGKIKSHSKKKSSKTVSYSVGQAIGGDLLFIDSRLGKSPTAVFVDINTSFLTVCHIMDKTSKELYRAICHTKGVFNSFGHQPSVFIFDRERGVETILEDIQQLGMTPRLKAAKQHIGIVEVSNRLIREVARSTKAGIHDLFGYWPPIQWNKFLVSDTVDLLNRRIPTGKSISPYTLFTGLPVDRSRDFRVPWGYPIIVKRSKLMSADMNREGLWAIPVRRYMNHTGVIMVYIIQSKSYRHILKFRFARIPDWVIDALKSIPDSQPIRFDEDDDGPPALLDDSISDDESDSGDNVDSEVVSALDTIDAAEASNQIDEAVVEQARDVLREAYHHEVAAIDLPDEMVVEYNLPVEGGQPVARLRGAAREMKNLEINANFDIPDAEDIGDGPRRSARERKPFIPLNIERFHICNEHHFILLEQALKSNRRDAALKALDKELNSAEAKHIWDPIHERDLTPDQKKFIIDGMTNFVEKTLPDGSFDKFKSRILARGDQESEVGETASPVCRVESVFLIVVIAALLDLEVFKLDIVSAYLNTQMPDSVNHQWILLPKHVSSRLVELWPSRYEAFIRPRDQKILVHMNSLIYGYKEASLGWFLTYGEIFDKNGYLRMPKDQCFIYKHGTDKSDIFLGAITVDDTSCAVTRNSILKKEFIDCVSKKFEYTIEEGDVINCIGMTFNFDRINHAVSVTQSGFARKVVDKYSVTKKSKCPAGTDLFDEDPTSPALKNQLSLLEINSSCNFAATRTYPELLPCRKQVLSWY